MPKSFYAFGALAGCLFAQTCFAQPDGKKMSLYVLQEKTTEGNHVAVQVAGVYRLGLDMGVLEDAACPKQATWVELALRSGRNKEKLRQLLDLSGKAYVVFQGESYGPDVADPKLPEAIRKSYHPGWGHLAAFRTKLVVHLIRSVRAVRAGESVADDPPK